MAIEERSIVHPEPRVWEFGDRSFTQNELTIDGEVALLQLVGRTIQKIGDSSFPWDKVAQLVDQRSEMVDVRVAADLATQLLVYVPEFAVEACLIMFGVFELDEDDKPNPSYAEDKRYLRRHIRIATLVDVFSTFIDQNEYRRLIDPFVTMARNAVQPYLASPAEPEKAPTSPRSSSSRGRASASRSTSPAP